MKGSSPLAFALLGLLLLGACSGLPSRVPLREDKQDLELWHMAAEADLLRDRNKWDEALAIVDRCLARSPLFVPAMRIRQDYQRMHGRTGLAWAELDRWKEIHGESPDWIYLRGRLLPSKAAKEAWYLKAYSQAGNSYWISYGFAWTLLLSGNRSRHLAGLDLMLTLCQSEQHPWPQALLSTWDFQQEARWQRLQFDRVRARLVRSFPGDKRLLALTVNRGSTLSDRLASIQGAASSPRMREILAPRHLPRGQRRLVLNGIEDRPDLVNELIRAGATRQLADLALLLGREDLAEAWLRLALANPEAASAESEIVGARPSSKQVFLFEKQLRLLLLSQGRVKDAIRLFDRGARRRIATDGRNRLQRRFLPLFQAPMVGTGKEKGEVVLDRFLRVGWVEECVTLGRYLLKEAEGRDRDAIESRIAEAEQFLTFHRGLLELFSSKGLKKLDLHAFLEKCRALSIECYGRDVLGKSRTLEFPIIGSFVDPLGPGLPSFLDRYNRYALIGRLAGGELGAMIGPRLAVRRIQPNPALLLSGRCDEVILGYKEFSSFRRIDIDSVAGIAIWNHYVLDYRTTRAWASQLYQKALHARKQGRALSGAIAKDPIPRVPALDSSRPSDVQWKLAAKLISQKGWSREKLESEVLRLLRLHEHAHLVDAHRFLPVSNNLWRSIGLLAANGFSAEAVLADLELRAECAALAYGGDPTLALAHIADFHDASIRGANTQHSMGFSELLCRVVEHWHRDGAPGAGDKEHNLLAQIDLMPEDRAARYARKVLDEEAY